LKDAAIDVVAIATPNSSHFELTKKRIGCYNFDVPISTVALPLIFLQK
jgi:hypothetical protein